MVKMRVVSDAHMKRVLFQAWLEDYRETRRAKRWFKRERGGREDTSDGEEEWHWPEGEDPVSLLNRHITRKVLNSQTKFSCALLMLFCLSLCCRYSVSLEYKSCAGVPVCVEHGRRYLKTLSYGTDWTSFQYVTCKPMNILPTVHVMD